MLRIGLLAVLAFALAGAGPARAACAGADPAIVAAAVKNVSQANGINHYTIAVTVTNQGGQAQPKDTLQFVDISQVPGEKLDSKGVPPLQPGQSYTFNYVTMRSTEAGSGTTHLRFQIDMTQGDADCNAANDVFTLAF